MVLIGVLHFVPINVPFYRLQGCSGQLVGIFVVLSLSLCMFVYVCVAFHCEPSRIFGLSVERHPHRMSAFPQSLLD